LPLIENDLVEMPLVAELQGAPTDLAGAGEVSLWIGNCRTPRTG
jgi:hypothetical protein